MLLFLHFSFGSRSLACLSRSDHLVAHHFAPPFHFDALYLYCSCLSTIYWKNFSHKRLLQADLRGGTQSWLWRLPGQTSNHWVCIRRCKNVIQRDLPLFVSQSERVGLRISVEQVLYTLCPSLQCLFLSLFSPLLIYSYLFIGVPWASSFWVHLSKSLFCSKTGAFLFIMIFFATRIIWEVSLN